MLVQVSETPVVYERRHPDGSREVYSLSDGGVPGTRRVFLTTIVDPHGQTLTFMWDAQARLVALTDALGQVTTLQYGDGDPLKITSVTDPFGRIARLTYDGDGHLASVTDVINLRSTFTYGDADFIAAMQTPYGLTAFRAPTISGENARAVEAVDPLGAVERLEFWWQGAPVPATVPADQVPPGFEAANSNLDQITSIHWSRGRAIGNIAEATVWRWLLHSIDWFWDPGWSVGVPHSIQPPGEVRIWYAYTGSTAQPSRIARKLPDGRVYEVTSSYNDKDNLTWRRDPVGRETGYTYAANGIDLLESRNTTDGRTEVLAQYSNYTAGHLPQTTIDASGQATQTTYNDAGQVLTATNAKQQQTTYSYDVDGYLQTVEGPLSESTVTYVYDGYGRVTSSTQAGEAPVSTEYDSLNRPTRTTYPDGSYEEKTYDKLDLTRFRDRAGRITRLSHDALGRLTVTQDAAGRVTQRRWCKCGALDALFDANGNATKWERDATGRVLREIRADGATVTRVTYDALGQVDTVTDPQGQVTTFTHNLDGSVASVAYTNVQVPTPSVTWSYDPAYPRAATMTDGTGVTTYTYHPVGELGAGQLATVDGPVSNDLISYSYDELGRVVIRTVDSVPVTWRYDALGRIEQEVNVLGTFGYAFDGMSSRLSTVTYPNSQVTTYTYLPAVDEHRLQTIHYRYPDGATLARFDYTYDSVGNIMTWRQQSDTTAILWEYAYDNVDQLTRAVKHATDPPATVLQRAAYGYDRAGNRVFEQLDDTVTSWTYDRLNRLVTQSVGGSLRVAGTVNEPAAVRVQGQPALLDAAGQFVASVQVGSGTTRFTIVATDASGNTINQAYDVDETGSPKAFTSDPNGNLTSDGTATFEWDSRGQLVAFNKGAHRTEFQYDGRFRRTTRVEKESGVTVGGSRYIWADSTLVVEQTLDGASVVRQFDDLGEQQSGVNLFYAKDHLGSTTDLVDGSGVLRARYAYDPFGRGTVIAGDLSSGRNFGGHQYHADSGLTLTLFRAYSPEYARWLSRDPLGPAASPNLYAYVENQPVKLADPFGLASVRTINCDKDIKGQSAKLNEVFGGICKAVAQPGGCRQLLSQYRLLDGFEKQCREGITVECYVGEDCGGVVPSRPPLIRIGSMAFGEGTRCAGGQEGKPPMAVGQTLAHEMAHVAGVPIDGGANAYGPAWKQQHPDIDNWRRAEEVAYACRQPQ